MLKKTEATGSVTGWFGDLVPPDVRKRIVDSPEAEDVAALRVINVEFGHLVREKRRAWGGTQVELSGRTGIAKSTIARIESGSLPGGPRLSTIAKLLLACNHKLVAKADILHPPATSDNETKVEKRNKRDHSSASLSIVHSADDNHAYRGVSSEDGKPHRKDKSTRSGDSQNTRSIG